MGTILDSKVELIEQHIVGQSLRRRYQLGAALGGQFLSQFFDATERILPLAQKSGDAGRSTLDGGGRHLDVLLVVDQILPLDVVRTDLALELVPPRGGEDDPAALVLIPLQQAAHASGGAGRLLGGDGVGGEGSRCGDARDAAKGAGHPRKGFSAGDGAAGALFYRVGASSLDAGDGNEESDAGSVHIDEYCEGFVVWPKGVEYDTIKVAGGSQSEGEKHVTVGFVFHGVISTSS